MSTPTPTSTTALPTATPISHFYTCPDGWPPGVWCDYYPDGQPAGAPSTHALQNAMLVLKLSLLAFIALRLVSRRASLSALIGLCLIAGGFLYDVGFRIPSVEAVDVPTTTTITITAPLIPIAFASPHDEKLTQRSAAAAQGDVVSPIWITYYSTTTTWLPVATVTAPPVQGAMISSVVTTDSVDSSVMTGVDWPENSLPAEPGSVCTEADQAVCPIVEGRKTGSPPRVVSAA